MKEKLVKKNLSVGKVLQIIEILANSKGTMSLKDISLALNLPASTALRFLSTLIANNYAYQDENTLHYGLTMKICQVGELVRLQFSIRDIARPYLVELSEKCQESSCLAIEDDMTVVYIDVVEGPDKMLRTLQRIGKTAPLHSTGVGKLILVEYSNDKLNRYVKEKGLTPLTEHTITTKKNLVVELNKIKLQGYAIDDEECEIGARCIAAPIKDYTGNTVACISISGPVSRMNSGKTEVIKEHIKIISDQISQRLGFLQ